MKDFNILAIIPARGGSKRIPNKNIRNFHGKPIICYPIEALINSKLVDNVTVSTDSEEVSDIAKGLGAKVPFMRSTENSDDNAPLRSVIQEVVEYYNNKEQIFDFYLCVFPCSFSFKAEWLKESLDLLSESEATSIVSILPFGHPVQRGIIVNEGYIQFKDENVRSQRTQDLEEVFHDAGQFYLAKRGHFENSYKFISGMSLGYEVSPLDVQDIDNEVDWKIAEAKYRYSIENEG